MNNIAYCRKSTESEDRQVLSLDSQVAELQRLAERDGAVIAKVFTESKSAKSSGRETFNEMLSLIRKKGDCVLYAWKPDRIARNMADGGLIIELMDQGILKEVRTLEKTFRNIGDDKFMLGLDFGMSKKYVDDLSVNVKRGIRAKLESGVWHNVAPLGYLNNKADKSIMLDPVSSLFIKIIFDRYASGAYNLRTLAKTMYSDGLRTRAGRKVDIAGIRRILKNPFYYGMMLNQGNSYQGNHTPLISKELFDQANDVLSGKHQSKRQTHIFPLGGFMTCAVCGCALTATLQKRKYTYYYCTNGKNVCGERKKHLTGDHATALVASLFETLPVNERLLDIVLEAEEKMYQTEAVSRKATRQTLQKQLAVVKDQQDTLVRRKDTPEDIYARNMASLQRDQVNLELQLSKLDADPVKGEITFEQVKKVFLTANNAAKAFTSADSSLQREYAETILSNVLIKNQNVADYLFKKPYQRIANITDKRDLQELRPG